LPAVDGGVIFKEISMPARYIPGLIVFIALIFGGAYSYHVESSYINGMTTTKGEVVAFGSRSTSTRTTNDVEKTVNTQAIVNFVVNNETYRVEGRAMGYPDWVLGQDVEVYFAKHNPNEARINRWDEIYFFTLICSFFISTTILFSIINFIVYKVRGRPLS